MYHVLLRKRFLIRGYRNSKRRGVEIKTMLSLHQIVLDFQQKRFVLRGPVLCGARDGGLACLSHARFMLKFDRHDRLVV